MRLFPILILCFTFGLIDAAAAPATSPLRQFNDGYLRSERLGIAHISGIDVPYNPTRYQRALILGAGWNRWPLYWNEIEKAPGEFDWSRYDAIVKADSDVGLQTNLILLGIPEFYRAGDSIADLYQPAFADGSDLFAPGKAPNPNNPWATFVYKAALRYMPGGDLAGELGWTEERGIRLWEVWNEPDYEQFWKGGVRDYARMLKVAWLIIHSLDAEATVMTGGMLYPTQRNWLAEVLGQYTADPQRSANKWYMDAVAVHNYGDSWRSGWLTLYVRQTLVEFQMERPIYLNETGVPVWDDYPGPIWMSPGDRPDRATSTQQAAFLVQSASYAWAEGAQSVFYHQLQDDCGNQPAGTNFPPHLGELCLDGSICFGDAFGMYRNPVDSACFAQHPQPETPRPVVQAYSLLSYVFGGQPFSRRGVVDDERPDGAVTITFSRPATNERIVVAWNTNTYPIYLEIPAEGVAARIVMMEGELGVQPVNDAYLLELPAAEMPRQRDNPNAVLDIGGAPVILIEPMLNENAVAELRRLTYEAGR
jgi:hypothetical protein